MRARLVFLLCCLALAPAGAQQPDAAAPLVAQPQPTIQPQENPAAPAPAPPAQAAPAPIQPRPAQTSPAAGLLFMTAQFAGANKTVPSGLVWRVFSETRGQDDEKPVATSTDATPSFQLEPGPYIVHVSYGMAGAVRRITVGQRETNERIVISAGGLKLAGAIGQAVLPSPQMSFTIYAPVGNNSEGRLVASNVKSGEVLRLPEGLYHVVSSYGDTNSITRADLKVESGRVTEATMNHRAATVTLKLVANPGGEALAGTAFSVLTPGGDVIREAIGAFPAMILAEGEYICIARHQSKVYQRPFKVDSGLDRDIEVLAR